MNERPLLGRGEDSRNDKLGAEPPLSTHVSYLAEIFRSQMQTVRFPFLVEQCGSFSSQTCLAMMEDRNRPVTVAEVN